MEKRNKPKNIVEKHLSEKVSYGGKVVTRKEMIVDLQNIARTITNDKNEQRKLVDAYLIGHELIEKKEGGVKT